MPMNNIFPFAGMNSKLHHLNFKSHFPIGPPPMFHKDYDFEEANQQFREKIIEDQKDKDGDENEEQQQQEESPEFYNKTLSFFDNISCDALEKATG